jgi:hypothetical protein
MPSEENQGRPNSASILADIAQLTSQQGNAFTANLVQTKCFVATLELRLVKPKVGLIETIFKPENRLQQLWQCKFSGDREWRDVPIVDNE